MTTELSPDQKTAAIRKIMFAARVVIVVMHLAFMGAVSAATYLALSEGWVWLGIVLPIATAIELAVMYQVSAVMSRDGGPEQVSKYITMGKAIHETINKTAVDPAMVIQGLITYFGPDAEAEHRMAILRFHSFLREHTRQEMFDAALLQRAEAEVRRLSGMLREAGIAIPPRPQPRPIVNVDRDARARRWAAGGAHS